ncbi:MAG: alpha/beta hydrolase [Candidatus Paceibacterota bacterium]
MISNLNKKYKILLYLLTGIIILGSCWIIFVDLFLENNNPFSTAPENTKWVKIDDNQVAYQYFPSQSGADNHILLIGGTTAWSGVWEKTVDDLNESYSIYTLDLPPFGYSAVSNDYKYNLRNQAQLINDFIDELQINNVTLVAHSYGAGPSMEAVFLNQETYKKLIVIDGSIHVDRASSKSAVAAEYTLKLPQLRYFISGIALHFPGFMEASLKYLVHDNDTVTDYWIDVYRQPLSLENKTQHIARWFYDFAFRNGEGLSSSGENYEDLSVPVDIIWGEEDTFTPLEQGTYLNSIIPKSSITTIENVGHIPMIDNHEDYIEVLKTLLKK